MPLPAGVETVTVASGEPLSLPDGTWIRGRLLFTGPGLVTIAEDDTVLGGGTEATLTDGEFSIELVATDATGMDPTGWTYTVTSRFTNAPNWVRYISLPKANPAVKLADVLVPDPVVGTYATLVPLGELGGAALLDVGTTADTVAAGNTLAQANAYTDAHGGGGGGTIVSDDGRINEEIITLAAAAGWTIVTTSGGVEIGKSIPAKAGDRIWFSPSFLRTGGVVFLDIGIKAAAGGVSRYISSGTSTPRDEGYASLYPLSQFVGVAGVREFIAQAGEIDGSGNVKIVLAYKGPADGNQKLYFGGGYDGAFFLANPDA